MANRMDLDPLCAEAALLRQAHAGQTELFASGAEAGTLARVVREHQLRELRAHAASCPDCLRHARRCGDCGVDTAEAEHRLICPRVSWNDRFRRVTRFKRVAPPAPPPRAEATRSRSPDPPRPARPSAASPLPAAYRALGLKPGASPAEARAVYRELAKIYHPDATHHLAPEKRAVAERRMKQINEAYDTLSRGRA